MSGRTGSVLAAALLILLLAVMTTAVAGLLGGCENEVTMRTPEAVETTTTLSSTTTTTEPTTTTTAATTTTTEAPPVPLLLPGYEQAKVRTVSVVIHDSYPGIEGGPTPLLTELVVDALETMGLVGIDAGLDGDAALSFELENSALSDRYSGEAGDVTVYSGAAYTGTAEFSVPGLGSESWEVDGRFEPPFMVTESRPTPADAPFEAAFVEPMLDTLTRVWGLEATLETIEVWPQGTFFEVLADGAANWVASVATQAMPRLLEMRLSENYGISERAYMALIEIVGEKAVSTDDRSRIVRTLISDMESPDHYAGQALGYIAEGDEDAYYYDQEGEIIGPWDAEAWSKWADAHGY